MKRLILIPLLIASAHAATIINPLPNNIQNGQPADATKLMGNFNQIVANVNSNAASLGASNTFTAGQQFPGATSLSQGVIASQVQNDSFVWLGVSAGTANALAGTSIIAPAAYAAGQRWKIVASAANTGSATININSLGARLITKFGSNALVAGDIGVGQLLILEDDGTELQLMNPTTVPAATSAGSATTANSLATTTSPVVVNTAVAPTAGQSLTATSPTSATWQAVGTTGRQTILLGPTDVLGRPAYLPQTSATLNLTTVNIAANSSHSASVTMPVASPGVVNWTGHNLIVGQAVSFTGSSFPTGVSAGVVYYVLAAGYSANSFEISTTPGGTAINFVSTSCVGCTGWAGETNPLVVTAQNGFNTSGQNNVVGTSTTNLTWTGLTNSTTNYLYVTVLNGALTTGFTTLAPVVQAEGLFTPSIVSGQITINAVTGMTYVGNGSSFIATPLVLVGTAVTSGTSVTSTYGSSYNMPVSVASQVRQVFTSSGAWIKPSWLTGNEVVEVEIWGGGGGGAGGGGGGGAYNQRRFMASQLNSSETVTVGSGGAGAFGSAGSNGGNSSFGTTPYLYAYGGAGGAASLGIGGGGGGTQSAGSGSTGGSGYSSRGTAAANTDGAVDGGGGGSNSALAGSSFWGGGGGGCGSSTFGGGGGGITSNCGGAGGVSLYGGSGGAMSGNPGIAPAGGGAANGSGAGGAGARGEVRVTIYKVN